jgi:formylglycine-generating enzyme required for sulfatase activity
MGSSELEGRRDEDEGPQRRVAISRPFLIQTTEVTRELWEQILSVAPAPTGDCGPQCPLNSVNWYEAIAFANRFSIRDGLRSCYQLLNCTQPLPGQGCPAGENECNGTLTCESVDRVFGCTGYRLPTEAEWEYAARAGTETRFWFGEDEAGLQEAAWFSQNAGQRPHDVGTRTPSPWGLIDVYGNVAEWTWDWYGAYPDRSERNPAGPTSGQQKVVRGGSFSGRAKHSRSADRGKQAPQRRGVHFGMRYVREVTVPEPAPEAEPE